MTGGRSGNYALQSLLNAGNRAWKYAFPSSSRKRRLLRYPNQTRIPRLKQPPPRLITYKGNVYSRTLKPRGGLHRHKHRHGRHFENLRMIPKLPSVGPSVMIPKPLPNLNPMPPTTVATAVGVGAATTEAVGTIVVPSSEQTSSSSSSSTFSFYDWIREWLKQNGPVLILNFGSICTLVGFTRQDILDLRVFSMSGSICSVIYFSLQGLSIKWAPIAWSALFASVNGWKIMGILNERNSSVILTDENEALFVEHFMPHGVTPKQFEILRKKGTLLPVKKGDLIVRQGQTMNQLYLVVRGNTMASILGRRLTAASSHPGDHQKMGGDSGAWIGEMVFLQQFGNKEAQRTMKTKKQTEIHQSIQRPSSSIETTLQRADTGGKALYTIIAETDSILLKWSFDEIEQLMRKSIDLRGAMTRAMTAPIVGKVINFSISRSTGRPNWAAWLDDWRSSGAKTVTTLHHYLLEDPHKNENVVDEEEEVEDGDEDGFDFDHDDDDEGDEEVEKEILNRISDLLPIPSSR